jgi:Zn finger protein HypA/HybF involved in hydrogenase expression
MRLRPRVRPLRECCRRCNKIFTLVSGLPVCPECTKEDERIFNDVSKFIRENADMSLQDVSDALDISYDKLLKYVKEGRLQIRAADGGFVMFCEKCGGMISKGRFCSKCENHITNVLEISKSNLVNKLSEKSKSEYKYLSGDAKKK